MIEVVVTRGLCNRMRTISSAIQVQRLTKKKLTIFWYKNSALNCSFSKLFKPIPGVNIVEIETVNPGLLATIKRVLYKIRYMATSYDLILDNSSIESLRKEGTDIAELIRSSRRCRIDTVHRFYGNPPYFSDFVPVDEVLAVVNREQARQGVNVLGVHIRRTDNLKAIENSPIDLFVDQMKAELAKNSQIRFFLATDDPATEAAIQKEFPGAVFVRDKSRDRDSEIGIIDALIDLWLLSRAEKVIGSYWSSFSNTAAEISNIEKITVRK